MAGWGFPTKKDMGCTLSNHVSRGSALSATFSSRYGLSPGAELRQKRANGFLSLFMIIWVTLSLPSPSTRAIVIAPRSNQNLSFLRTEGKITPKCSRDLIYDTTRRTLVLPSANQGQWSEGNPATIMRARAGIPQFTGSALRKCDPYDELFELCSSETSLLSQFFLFFGYCEKRNSKSLAYTELNK